MRGMGVSSDGMRSMLTSAVLEQHLDSTMRVFDPRSPSLPPFPAPRQLAAFAFVPQQRLGAGRIHLDRPAGCHGLSRKPVLEQGRNPVRGRLGRWRGVADSAQRRAGISGSSPALLAAHRYWEFWSDEPSNTLWVCSDDLSSFGAKVPGAAGGSALIGFDLKTGAGKVRAAFPGGHNLCNDMAIGADGSAYVTNSDAPQILEAGGRRQATRGVVQRSVIATGTQRYRTRWHCFRK